MSLDPEMGITGNWGKSLPAFQGEMRKKGAEGGEEKKPGRPLKAVLRTVKDHTSNDRN